MMEYKPRLCHVTQGATGYGFHLHGEKGKFGQFIRKVESGSPAEISGLKAGDRIVTVNGHNVENDSHHEVVSRIKERSGETDLLVVDEDADKYFKDRNIAITEELLVNGVSVESAEKEEQVPLATTMEESAPDNERRPRLCHLVRDGGGFGFNLHSDKTKKGRYIRAVDDGGLAANAGLKAGDRLIEVNGVNMEYHRHADVVNTIKEAGQEVDLLVVDEETDKFFQSCEVTPTQEHVTGPLPTPKEVPTTSPSELGTSNGTTPSNGTDLLNMDLTMLKERSKSNRKAKAPTSNWNNRQAIFNNL